MSYFGPSRRTQRGPRNLRDYRYEHHERQDRHVPQKHFEREDQGYQQPNFSMTLAARPQKEKGDFKEKEKEKDIPERGHDRKEGKLGKEGYQQKISHREIDFDRLTAASAYFDRTKVNSDAFIRRDLYLGHRLFTSPYNERILIGSIDAQCPHLQAAINTLSGQHAQAKLISLGPGTYPGHYRLDRLASTVSIDGLTLGLRIIGDNRPLAGMTYVSGCPFLHSSEDSKVKKGDPIKIESTDGNKIRIFQGSQQLDFISMGLVKDDTVLIQTANSLFERVVTEVEKESFSVNGNPLNLSENCSVTFCPNVVFTFENPEQDYLCVIADASVTFKGIRFSSKVVKLDHPVDKKEERNKEERNKEERKKKTEKKEGKKEERIEGKKGDRQPRSVLSVVGSSVVNMMNCLVEDVEFRCHSCVSLSYGAILF